MKRSYYFLLVLLFIFINPKIIVIDPPDSASQPRRLPAQAQPLPAVVATETEEPTKETVEIIPRFPDDTLKKRLEALNAQAVAPFSPAVREFIKYFTIQKRDYLRRVIARSEIYYPLFEKYLKKYNLPPELKHLAVAESALVPTNVSPVGAAGLWQLMIPTAQEYGLTYSPYVDERMDPERSTDAACRLLQWLYYSFNDWELALAAYNFGYGNVRRAIAKAGEASFSAACDYLPRETRWFIPQFAALVYIMNYYEEHNLQAAEYDYQPLEPVLFSGYVNLERLSEQINYSLDDLREHNPHLKAHFIPQNTKGIQLYIPSSSYAYVVFNYAPVIKPFDQPGPYSPDNLAATASRENHGIAFNTGSGAYATFIYLY